MARKDVRSETDETEQAEQVTRRSRWWERYRITYTVEDRPGLNITEHCWRLRLPPPSKV